MGHLPQPIFVSTFYRNRVTGGLAGRKVNPRSPGAGSGRPTRTRPRAADHVPCSAETLRPSSWLDSDVYCRPGARHGPGYRNSTHVHLHLAGIPTRTGPATWDSDYSKPGATEQPRHGPQYTCGTMGPDHLSPWARTRGYTPDPRGLRPAGTKSITGPPRSDTHHGPGQSLHSPAK